jgi:hypothetical protein
MSKLKFKKDRPQCGIPYSIQRDCNSIGTIHKHSDRGEYSASTAPYLSADEHRQIADFLDKKNKVKQ